ncbi:phospholipase D family protein [Bacillus tianshenii]|nr:phospholipase D family protein [Bacillus tianshenii]
MTAYITKNPLIQQIDENPSKDIKLLVLMNLKDFVSGASDLTVIKHLSSLEHVDIRYYSNLHAKIYLFGREKAVLTSANFTSNGLYHNMECGIILNERIEQIYQDVTDLWVNSTPIDETLIIKIEEEINKTTIKQQANELIDNLELASKNIIKPNRSHTTFRQKGEVEENEHEKLIDEEQALVIVFKKQQLRNEEAKEMKMIYQTIKRNIPTQARDDCAFRYTIGKRSADIACNIRNNRIFLLPYTKKQFIQLIYPLKEVGNLEGVVPKERRAALEKWTFRSFPCLLVRFTIEEVNMLDENHWKYFNQACMMALHAKKSRLRKKNILVNWI